MIDDRWKQLLYLPLILGHILFLKFEQSILLPVNISKILLDEWQSVQTNQMSYSALSGLGLHCLLRPVCTSI